MTLPVRFRERGIVDYTRAWSEMRSFTEQRTESTPDEIWFLQHSPVYTQGVSCHSLPRENALGIPVVHSDRGGQITYHGPGQLIVYPLMNIRRRRLGPRSLVNQLEQVVVDLLQQYGISGQRRPGAPGVYVRSAKVAALGLRIHNGGCYHGLSLNVDMDLTPYDAIDPCGYAGLAVTQLRDLGVTSSLNAVQADLRAALVRLYEPRHEEG